jgi:hypothetical protein
VTINNCKVTVEGNVWITGNLTVSDYAELIVKNGLTSPPNIIVDGSTGVTASSNVAFKSNNSTTPVGFKVVTYYSTNSCTIAVPPTASCTNLTGTDLYNSQSLRTIYINNYINAPNTQFYARWSLVHMDSLANVGSLVGQTVKATNNSTIEFGLGEDPSQGGTASWAVDTYKRIY